MQLHLPILPGGSRQHPKLFQFSRIARSQNQLSRSSDFYHFPISSLLSLRLDEPGGLKKVFGYKF
jgi:hypothetical protein